MKVGIPKEIKNNENRVSLTPGGTQSLIQHGHTVYIETQAGINSGFSDEAYIRSGAQILPTAKEVFTVADMIMKVKEPTPVEYDLILPNQLIFTYLHLAADRKLTEEMIQTGAVFLAYETVEKDHSLPLLIPMSEVAGRMSVQQGAKYLEKPQGGKGILLGGVPGVKPANILILGGGIVGTQAAFIAAGSGAHVTILDISLPRLRYLSDIMPANVDTMISSQYNIEQMLPSMDLVIGAVLIPGAKAPCLITNDMLKLIKPGSVMVDVAIDQGGCFESSHPTTHAQPIYEVGGVIHYCITNIPGAVPMTSTLALTNATLPYALLLADYGWENACAKYPDLKAGLNIVKGKIVYKAVADAFGLKFEPI